MQYTAEFTKLELSSDSIYQSNLESIIAGLKMEFKELGLTFLDLSQTKEFKPLTMSYTLTYKVDLSDELKFTVFSLPVHKMTDYKTQLFILNLATNDIMPISHELYSMFNFEKVIEPTATVDGNIIKFPNSQQTIKDFIKNIEEVAEEAKAEKLAVTMWGSSSKEVLTGYYNCDQIDKMTASNHIQLDAIHQSMKNSHPAWHGEE